MNDWQSLVERYEAGELSGVALRTKAEQLQLTTAQQKELAMIVSLSEMLTKVCDLPSAPDGALDRLRLRLPDDANMLSLDDDVDADADADADKYNTQTNASDSQERPDVIGRVGPSSMPDVMAAGKEFHSDDEVNGESEIEDETGSAEENDDTSR